MSRNRKRFYLSASILSTVAFLMPGAVMAQSSANSSDTAESGEIIVTATRRAEALSKVPLSVQALSTDTIVERGIEGVEQLQRQFSGLTANSSNGGLQTLVTIRGIGISDFNPAAPPTVAYYNDELYINSTFAQIGQYYDVNRIEVLRGPQGTLYGKNTTAGVIAIVNARPSDTPQGYAVIEAANYNRHRVEGALGGPLIDGVLEGRISFIHSDFRGYYYDAGQGKHSGGNSFNAARAQLKWIVSDNTDILLRYETARMNAQLQQTHIGALAGGADTNGYISEGPFRQQINSIPESKTKLETRTATLNHTFDGGLQLTSITGYMSARTRAFYDDDQSPFNVEAAPVQIRSSQYSNETRLSSPQDEKFRWIVGGFLFREKLHVFAPFVDFTGGLLAQYDQKTTSYAGFASVSYDLTDRLTATVGARYSVDKVSTDSASFFFTPDPRDYLNVNRGTGFFQYFAGSAKFRNSLPTGDVSLKYSFDNDMMAYLRVARGARSATFNNLVFPGDTITRTKPEKLTSYELGLKGRVGSSFQYDAGVFYYDFSNKQVTQLINGFQRLLSQASVTVKGVELTASYRPFDGMELGTSLNYLDAKYGDFPNAVISTTLAPAGVVDLTDQRLARTSKWSANPYLQYEFPVGEGNIKLRTDWAYKSSTYFRDELADISAITFAPGIDINQIRKVRGQPGFWVGDVNITYAPSETFSISAYVRNVTDKRYLTTGGYFSTTRAFTMTYGAPRTFGAQLRYNFN